MYVDSRGLLWIGTYDGISVYDGYEIKNFKRFEIGESGIEAYNIMSITEDPIMCPRALTGYYIR